MARKRIADDDETTAVAVRLPTRVVDRIEAAAQDAGVDRSTWLRATVESALDGSRSPRPTAAERDSRLCPHCFQPTSYQNGAPVCLNRTCPGKGGLDDHADLQARLDRDGRLDLPPGDYHIGAPLLIRDGQRLAGQPSGNRGRR